MDIIIPIKHGDNREKSTWGSMYFFALSFIMLTSLQRYDTNCLHAYIAFVFPEL